MFTGIVLERGRLAADPTPAAGGIAMSLAHSRELGRRLQPGASLAVNGVCLTVVEPAASQCRVELSPETLSRTSLGGLGEGDEVNLEPALRAGDPMGGHWMQGHVDGLVELKEVRRLGDHREMVFELPAAFEAYAVEKGSVALDGVSLTVSALRPGEFETALIPHTLEVTTLGALTPGDRLNFEADILAKYVEKALRGFRDRFGIRSGWARDGG